MSASSFFGAKTMLAFGQSLFEKSKLSEGFKAFGIVVKHLSLGEIKTSKRNWNIMNKSDMTAVKNIQLKSFRTLVDIKLNANKNFIILF